MTQSSSTLKRDWCVNHSEEAVGNRSEGPSYPPRSSRAIAIRTLNCRSVGKVNIWRPPVTARKAIKVALSEARFELLLTNNVVHHNKEKLGMLDLVS
ncbi:hypothetical protein V6N11_070128 [Hibiscus sabdariffa]|uniref:Uncharacterized protein n=1 Tax=Hibiscus sabdariffa TaxID=183260 RepID=A0ABR2QEC7_9ROSI